MAMEVGTVAVAIAAGVVAVAQQSANESRICNKHISISGSLAALEVIFVPQKQNKNSDGSIA